MNGKASRAAGVGAGAGSDAANRAQPPRTRAPSSAAAVARSCTEAAPSVRGSATCTYRFSARSLQSATPGVAGVSLAASSGWINDSSGELSASSKRVSITSSSGRGTAAQRDVLTIRCTPWRRPVVPMPRRAAARSWKSSANSAHPSTTRKRSPTGWSASSPRARAPRYASMESIAGSRSKSCSRRALRATARATVRCTPSGSWRCAKPRTCGRCLSRRSPPPPRSMQWNSTSCGVWVRANEVTSVCSSRVLPLRGPPATATCPAPPDRSTKWVWTRRPSARWERPIGVINCPLLRHSSAERPRSGVTASGGSNWSTVASGEGPSVSASPGNGRCACGDAFESRRWLPPWMSLPKKVGFCSWVRATVSDTYWYSSCAVTQPSSSRSARPVCRPSITARVNTELHAVGPPPGDSSSSASWTELAAVIT